MPVQLATRVLEKIWGAANTEPWYRNSGNSQVGEIWFEASDQTPLLVKLLFTSSDLSVQVHPGDAYAHLHENGSRGKTEMWHVLRAEPGAKLAVGLKQPETPERVREAALSGEIMDLLQWIEVRPGDTFFIPAGTIHAIGGGLALCEVQQLSDVTYRLYDFGRGRELHLYKSLDVAHLGPYLAKTDFPVECPYFRTERLECSGAVTLEPHSSSRLCIALAGAGTIAGLPFEPGQGWEIAANEGPLRIESPAAVLLLTRPLVSQR